MDKVSFSQLLSKKSRKAIDVEQLITAVFTNTNLVTILLENIGCVDNEASKYDARILELAAKKDSKILLQYLDDFCVLLNQVKLDAPVRACAKMIELLCVGYFVKSDSSYLNTINNNHLEQFIEACFDWMIADKATAIQAHSMYSLYLLGTKYDWIHTELAETINKSLPYGSIGYQNRGKKIIRAIETGVLLKLY